MLAALALLSALALTVAAPAGAGATPLSTRAMWIWELGQSNGGSPASIISRARHHGIHTLIIKSGDGSSVWSQFSRGLVARLHAAHERVCAWQYVYGNFPVAEAQVGAAAVSRGANCLIIDAESEYEGKYISAQTYIRTLRGLIGSHFPVGLAGFPYVDYHPGFPYSVFLGPGGAQYNVPQMYWYDIGTSVDRVYAHTYAFNRIYRRAIFPLGQITGPPPKADVRRFRAVARAYHAGGVSWWDWQEGSAADWSAVSEPLPALGAFVPDTAYATLGQRARGDLVVWAQEHLVGAGQPIPIDGNFGAETLTAVKRFQAAHGLLVDGLIGTATWRALLRYAPAPVRWTSGGARVALARGGAQPVPKSATLPAKADELRGPSGAGSPGTHK
ncbi:MAG: peptidoglycan-binding protein [Solirubrobacterales bacterium]|nr:peptidoglycan-binding protein [Solirubrobacterales bacterium]